MHDALLRSKFYSMLVDEMNLDGDNDKHEKTSVCQLFSCSKYGLLIVNIMT